MSIESDDRGREFIGPDQIICIKKRDIGCVSVRQTDVAWAGWTAACGLLQQGQSPIINSADDFGGPVPGTIVNYENLEFLEVRSQD
jgi:hypothetical protein